MSKLKLLLTGLAFAYRQLLVFMHTAQWQEVASAIIPALDNLKNQYLNPYGLGSIGEPNQCTTLCSDYAFSQCSS